MSYFAQFQMHDDRIFRFDTRIYLHESASPSRDDPCVAAIVGKNPGSASPIKFDDLSELSLSRDNMLPSVRNRFIDAYKLASKPIPPNAFVRVWNLFYLCEKELKTAIRNIQFAKCSPLCPTEISIPSIVWFAWGGHHMFLDELKHRFRNISPENAFYYDFRGKIIVEGIPKETEFAKHPRGLLKEPVVDYLSHHL